MSILRRVAANVTAADLQHPLGPFLLLNESIAEAESKAAAAEPVNVPYERRLDVPLETVCLAGPSVGCPTHYVMPADLWDPEPDEKVAKVAIELLLANCVAGDTPALKLASLLCLGERWPGRFVLNHEKVTGFVSERDLISPTFSIAVLALLLDVEQACIDACSWDFGDAEAAWDRIKPGRQAKARSVYVDRFGRRAEHLHRPEVWITCTMFIDKAAMVAGLPRLEGLSKTALHKQFSLMEAVRNGLAHGRMVGLNDLLQAIAVAEELLRRLRPAESSPIRLVVSNPDLPHPRPLRDSVGPVGEEDTNGGS